MTSATPNDRPLADDELIGAYFDGELSAEERARAERLLEESAECRALLEELRAMRASLKSLPRSSLESDFTESVLRRTATETQAVTSPRSETMDDGADEPPRWLRPLVYAGFAIAASVLLLLVVPRDEQGPQIARVDEHAEAVREADRAQPEAPVAAIADTAVDELREEPAAGAGRTVGKAGAAAFTARDADAASPAAPAESAQSVEYMSEPGRLADELPPPLTQQLATIAEDGALIVRLNVTEQARRERAFDALLSRQNIVWDDDSLGETDLAVAAPKTDGESPQAAQAAESADVVEVVASDEQLEAVLATLQSEPALFQNVEVEVSPMYLDDGIEAVGSGATKQAPRPLAEKSEDKAGVDSKESVVEAPATQRYEQRGARQLARNRDSAQSFARRVPIQVTPEVGQSPSNNAQAPELRAYSAENEAAPRQSFGRMARSAQSQSTYRQAFFILQSAEGAGAEQPAKPPARVN